MERRNYLIGLDEHFAAQYSDYVKISAIEGYRMPEIVYVAPDGNIARRDPSLMRLIHQEACDALIARFKEGLADTDFSFSFSFRTLGDRFRDLFSKRTFAKMLPAVLSRCEETAASAGEKLSVEPRFWKKIAAGKLYPSKNCILALGLVCRMQIQDVTNLLAVCGFSFDSSNVRDVVVEYLFLRKIFNAEMRDDCLAEYKITCLPIAHAAASASIQ